MFVQLIQDITTNRNDTLAGPAEAVIRSGAVIRGSEAKVLGLVDASGNLFTAVEKAASPEMADLWSFIIITADMTEVQKFLHALI